MPFLALCLAVSALVLGDAAQGQMPTAVDMHQPLLQEKALEQQEDAQQVMVARTNLESYSQRVSEYIEELQQRCDETHAMRGKVENRVAQLKKSLAELPVDQRGPVKSELDNLKNWLAAESGMSAQAEKNVRLCQQWLAYERSEVNNAEYGAAEAQQQIADEQLKLRQAQSELERQQRLLRDQEYWNARNEDDDYYYGGGYHGRGGYGYGYHFGGGHTIHVGGGGHSSGGSAATAHFGGGGHGGGHGGHR